MISRPEEWPLEYYPDVKELTENVLSHYAVVVEHDGKHILFHTISWSLWVLSKEEYEDVLNNEEFKRLKIVLDSSIDEDNVAKEVYLQRSQYDKEFDYKVINTFVIMTTTACNARCSYCYEEGLKPFGMSKKTADNIVKFIKEKKNPNKEVMIRWFGGEPLLRTDIIDHITDGFIKEGVEFRSDMVTNGYLLTDEVAEKFDKWKVQKVQITIDGTNEVYKAVKNYIYDDEDPLETVIGNIKNLAKKADTEISIRVNISYDNIDNVPLLLEYLTKEFADYSSVSIYTSIIYQIANDPCEIIPAWFEDRYFKICEDFPNVRGKYERSVVLKKDYLQNCGAEIGKCITIHPNGKFSPCEHWDDSDVVGNVVSGVTNTDVCEQWRRKDGKNIELCLNNRCPLLPKCLHSLKCKPQMGCGNEEKMKDKLIREKESIIKTYEYWRELAYGK